MSQQERYKLTVEIPTETHERIVALAEREERTLAGQARRLISLGLEADERERTTPARNNAE